MPKHWIMQQSSWNAVYTQPACIRSNRCGGGGYPGHRRSSSTTLGCGGFTWPAPQQQTLPGLGRGRGLTSLAAAVDSGRGEGRGGGEGSTTPNLPGDISLDTTFNRLLMDLKNTWAPLWNTSGTKHRKRCALEHFFDRPPITTQYCAIRRAETTTTDKRTANTEGVCSGKWPKRRKGSAGTTKLRLIHWRHLQVLEQVSKKTTKFTWFLPPPDPLE